MSQDTNDTTARPTNPGAFLQHAIKLAQRLPDDAQTGELRFTLTKLAEALAAQQPAASIPPGFALVPIEPTAEMLVAMKAAIDFDRSGQNTYEMEHPSHTAVDCGALGTVEAGTTIKQDMLDAWAAALAAAQSLAVDRRGSLPKENPEPGALTPERIKRHTLRASECPAGTEVLLVSSVLHLLGTGTGEPLATDTGAAHG